MTASLPRRRVCALRMLAMDEVAVSTLTQAYRRKQDRPEDLRQIPGQWSTTIGAPKCAMLIQMVHRDSASTQRSLGEVTLYYSELCKFGLGQAFNREGKV